MSDLRLGLIGAGVMGRVHADNVAREDSGAVLAAIADPSPEAREFARRVDVARVYAGYAEMLADAALDAVIVCSPGDTHGEVIEASVAAGLPVFTEKPIERDLGRADAAVAAAEKAGVPLMLAFNRRFDPEIRGAFEAVTSGALGRLLTLHIVARDPARESGVKEPGDIFLDTAIHDLDTSCWMAGAAPTDVTVAGGCIGGLDDPDYTITTIRFANGVIATIDNNRISGHGYDQRLEVCGTLGMRAVGPVTPLTPAPDEPFFVPRWRESYVEELRAFVDCVRQGKPVPVTGRDGRRALALAFAAHGSYLEGRPVSPSEIG